LNESESNLLGAAGSPTDLVAPAERLLLLWERGTQLDLQDFLSTAGELTPAQLATVLRLDQRRRWQAGERILVESYLGRYPQLNMDSEAVVDVIFHEFLLRERLGEQPQAREYRDRFPAHAEVLESQIALERALGGAAADPMASYPMLNQSSRVLGGGPQIGFVASGTRDHEVQTLLRKRLRLFAIISFGTFLLYVPVFWTHFTVSWGTALYWAVVSEVAIIGVLLSRRVSLSLRALRRIELGLFGGLLLFFAYQQVQFFQLGFYSTLALDTWIGPAIASRSLSWPWAVTIIGYGIIIPNTARRCMVVVVAMAAGFLSITLGLALTSTSVPGSAAVSYVLCSVTDIGFAIAFAIFGAYRIATLQLAAAEQRKLGPYRLIERLGGGGMGDVYLAEHALLRRPCALKLIRPEQGGDARSLARFEREVQAMATLTHPNTVRIYDYGLAADGTFYYAMEYLPGLSLQELVFRHGALPPARVTYLLRQVCGALLEAHAVGLVHRDIKPANILACQAGGMHDVAKLLDFGLVRIHNSSQDDNTLTGLGTIAGTPAFMSPEQAAGETDVDERCDIYSLGAVAYFLLTGRPPFVEPTSVQTMAAHLTAAVVSPSDLEPTVPADLEAIILRCLQKDRSERFPNVTRLDEALTSTECAKDWSSQAAAQWWQQTAGSPAGPVPSSV
jgi:eukaryotic-like serine/threonine-protein kinase